MAIGVAALVVEAALVAGAFALVRGPQRAHSTTVDRTAAAAEADRIAEVLVLGSRLSNNRSGATYLYDVEVYIQIKHRHLPRVTAELEQYHNEIRSELAAIWRTSEPHHFRETRLESLTGKVHALLAEHFGFDPLTGERIVKKTVIVMGSGYRVDG
jgi:hypothetical protein